MTELPNYITPDQLKEIGQTIATAIAAAKDLPSITLDELNAEPLNDFSKCTLRIVKQKETARVIMGYVLTVNFAYSYTQLFIGETGSDGDTETLAAPSVSAYGKQPGLSIAIRHNVVLNIFDKTVVAGTGITPWHVTQIADYNGLLALGGSDPNAARLWVGTEEEYAAITDQPSNTLHCII